MKASYTKWVQFYEEKKNYKNEKTNILFVTKNTHKSIFDIFKNYLVYQQKC